jgi:MFS family permease
VLSRLADGARVAMAEPGCRAAILLIAVVALVGSPFIALVPAMAIEGLHRGAGGTSALVTAQGVGAVAGALALSGLARRLGRRRLLLGALLVFPLTLVAYGSAPSLVVAVAAIAAVGAAYIGVLSGLNTVVQLRAPGPARGRVLGLYMMALGTIYPIGAVAEGALATHLGIRLVTACAGLVLAGAMAAVVRLRPSVGAALEDPVPAPAAAPAPLAP